MTKTALPQHPDPSVKTTVELPDTPYRKAKAEAALRGRKLQDLIEEGLNILLDSPPDAIRHPSLSKLIKDALGVVESGVFDVGSNAERLRDFGRNASNRLIPGRLWRSSIDLDADARLSRSRRPGGQRHVSPDPTKADAVGPG